MADGTQDPAPSPAAGVLLQGALRLALDVARARAAAEPAQEVPRAVRPFLRFGGRTLPEPAVAALWRWVDDDAEVRARMAELADDGELGRAGWLFVARPGGWEQELAVLVEDAEQRLRSEQEEKDERSARRKLSFAEEAKRRAEDSAARARADLAARTSELTAERKDRRAARDEADHLGRRVASLEGERESARRRAAEAAAEVTALQAELSAVRVELGQARAMVETLQAEAEAVAAQARARQRRAEAGLDPAPPAVAPPAVGLGAADVARAVASAAAAAGDLARALDQAATALAPVVGPSSAPTLAAPANRPPRPPAGPRRHPAPLPPAVFDDSTAAAAHLVRVPNAVVLVDGYNAAKSLWPDLPGPEMRDRLDSALAELVARTGARVHVVYDGADVGPQVAAGRRGVRVTFSPEGVEADDVILDLVDELPVTTAVVVASNDNRVRDGARSRGANVISIPQLAAVVGRTS